MFERLRTQIARLIVPTKNSMSLPQQFLRYGNKGSMWPDWTHVEMLDSESYTGYGYAAITNRANKVASIASDELRTDSLKENLVHPYLDLIGSSPTFTDYDFWKTISTYLDLEGIYYLMAIRAFDENRVGKVMEFKLLNPYNIRRVLRSNGLEVSGYVETRKGMVREIPKGMIIEMRELNPFDEDNPYSMTDAAKESQFTLKTAGDYTRHSLRNNINAPGILSTDVVLEAEEFKNFADRIKAHTKGEPIFGNGSGAITWENMQIELSKAALRDVNEVNREQLFGVSGVSKTIMGIEQSGVTRETGKVQKDLYIENHILPRIQLIIDSLNQDYRNNYPAEYETTRAVIMVNNPNASDQDAEIKDAEVKVKQFDLYNSLIDKGYDPEIAAKYVEGKIDIAALGEPTREPVTQVEQRITRQVENQVSKGLVQQQQGGLQNAVVNIQEQLASYIINKISKRKVDNQMDEEWGDLFSEESNLVSKAEKNGLKSEMVLVLTAFYGVILNLQGSKVMRDRTGEFALPGAFKLDKQSRDFIKDMSKKVANSHIDTISKELYETARKAALEGLSQDQVIGRIKSKYTDIAEERAKLVARTETNRAFTMAQYEADRQFVDQNKLGKRTYKQWRTRSSNPCQFCSALESEGPIPFNRNFRDVGGSVRVGKSVLHIDFASLEAGNAHPNCSCDYELIIKDK